MMKQLILTLTKSTFFLMNYLINFLKILFKQTTIRALLITLLIKPVYLQISAMLLVILARIFFYKTYLLCEGCGFNLICEIVYNEETGKKDTFITFGYRHLIDNTTDPISPSSAASPSSQSSMSNPVFESGSDSSTPIAGQLSEFVNGFFNLNYDSFNSDDEVLKLQFDYIKSHFPPEVLPTTIDEIVKDDSNISMFLKSLSDIDPHDKDPYTSELILQAQCSVTTYSIAHVTGHLDNFKAMEQIYDLTFNRIVNGS